MNSSKTDGRGVGVDFASEDEASFFGFGAEFRADDNEFGSKRSGLENVLACSGYTLDLLERRSNSHFEGSLCT